MSVKLGIPFAVVNATQRKLAIKKKPPPPVPEKREHAEQLSFSWMKER
jgi:hypothetical protein